MNKAINAVLETVKKNIEHGTECSVYLNNKPLAVNCPIDDVNVQMVKCLSKSIKNPSRVARMVINIAEKQGCYSYGGLRVVVINHRNHHAPSRAA